MMKPGRAGMWAAAAFAMVGMAAPAAAKDHYVRAGSDGDGTKESPYGDPWKALDKAVRGDVIHVAQGTYTGKGGSGHFVIKVPNLTLVGGYKADFSERHPFKYHTVLERAADYKGDWTGLPEGIIAGKEDHSGLIVDGFVLNGQSRNVYQDSGDINITKSYKGAGFQTSSANLRIRNCVVINPLGDGIYVTWAGKDNEVSNTIVVNTFYNGIATRSAQPDSVVRIKNTTVAFNWFYPTKGGGMSVFVGRLGKTIMEDNIFAFIQTEGGEAGYAVSNTFGNDETVLKGNVFFQAQGGYYKYMDGNKQSLLMWKPEELKELNKDGEPFMLAEASGNSDEDPKMTPEKSYFEKFSNFVASQPGKLNMNMMNEWRRSVGLPLQAEPGSKRKNYGMAYPLNAVFPNLISKLPGKGVQMDGPFASYQASGAAEQKTYAAATMEGFKKGAAGIKELNGKPVEFKAGLGSKDLTFFVKSAPRESHDCVKLLIPGASEPTRDYAFGYFLRGSEAAKEWDKLFKKKDKYKDGVIIKGTAFYAGSDTYNFPVGIVIDEVKKP